MEKQPHSRSMQSEQGVPGAATLYVVPGVTMLRPTEAVFEKMIEGFVEHQQARALKPNTIAGRVRTVRQLHAFADAFPWEWNASIFDRWSATVAAAVAHSTLGQKQLQLRAFLSYVTNTAYEWPTVCRELFGTFPTMALGELNTVRHSQGYVGQPSRNRPLTRPEVRAFFGQMDPEIGRLRAAGHKGALTAARDLALFTTMYAWGLRRRETAWLEIHDWRRQAKLSEFGDFAGLAVRWGKALPGQPPRRRMVISVWPWAVTTVRYYVENIRPLFYVDRQDDGVMFPTERDGEISIRSVNDRFAHWRALASLPDHLCPHCLRHTYVTRLIEAGYDASFVTEQVGHSHAATTAIYTALSSDYKNTKVREFLDAAEEEALRTAFARAEIEADIDDEFDATDTQPATTAKERRTTR
ncbi:tyrosine-type recombinase/integrase [Saccharothrix syringae]|uniref:Site-specific integrase n=1 Tax=Saccharothrix syringae TaxID=103733 RepID=A0A5Q0H386_SACSY|nr:tyrosine-type recombinase/integrase [Saccharothrix syringae]QFZ20543.1 site-specific integrase [Saccharothrix syringae]